jgi:hypothetical protein
VTRAQIIDAQPVFRAEAVCDRFAVDDLRSHKNAGFSPTYLPPPLAGEGREGAASQYR